MTPKNTLFAKQPSVQLLFIGLLLFIGIGFRFRVVWQGWRQNQENVVNVTAVMTHLQPQEGVTTADDAPQTEQAPTMGALAWAQQAKTKGNFAQAQAWLDANALNTVPEEQLYFQLCLLYWEAGQHSDAVTACQLAPNSADYWLNRAFDAQKARDTELALVNSRMATDTNPDNSEAWFRYGSLLVENKNYDEGIPALEQAYALNYPEVTLYIALGQSYRLNGQPAEGRRVLETGLQRFADVPRIYREIAESYTAEGNWEMADEWYSRALEKWPNDAKMWAQRSSLAYKFAHYQQAVAFAQQAVGLAPNQWTYWRSLATAAEKNDDVILAAEAYNEVLRLETNRVNVWLQAGEFFFQTDQLERSREIFEQVLVLASDNNQAQKRLADIEARLVSP